MIKSNLVYKVRCPNCGKHFNLQFMRDIEKSAIEVPCEHCNIMFMLHSNSIKRKYVDLKTFLDRFMKAVRNSKIYPVYERFRLIFWVVVVIALAITIAIFWFSELSKGRLWFFFRF